MSKIVPPAFVLAILLAGTLSPMTDAALRLRASASNSWTDFSDPYSGYAPNSQEGNRAFWDYQARHGGSR